ncbi:MAG: hypothetical protein WCI11_04090 [Candidatus Methylumidiphilus sp.]
MVGLVPVHWFFGLARPDYSTVTWPGEIDIAAETPYCDAVAELD